MLLIHVVRIAENNVKKKKKQHYYIERFYYVKFNTYLYSNVYGYTKYK